MTIEYTGVRNGRPRRVWQLSRHSQLPITVVPLFGGRFVRVPFHVDAHPGRDLQLTLTPQAARELAAELELWATRADEEDG
jgi:hypothetical protein